MPHKLRATRKFRGSRFHGYGITGQHRKKGTKGERKVGRHKGLWTYTVKYEPDYFGKKGFTSHKNLHQKINTINVGELEELANKLSTEKTLEKKIGKIFLDLEKLGYNKLLGTGKITQPILVKVLSHSETANKKLEEVGGQILKEKE